jgi:hypothetical protein
MKQLSLLFISVCFSIGLKAQKGLPSETPTTAIVHTSYPIHQDFSQSLVASLRVPDAFEIIVAASGLGKPRMMAMYKAGLYITHRDQGDVLLLSDEKGTGMFEKLRTVVTDFPR